MPAFQQFPVIKYFECAQLKEILIRWNILNQVNQNSEISVW